MSFFSAAAAITRHGLRYIALLDRTARICNPEGRAAAVDSSALASGRVAQQNRSRCLSHPTGKWLHQLRQLWRGAPAQDVLDDIRGEQGQPKMRET